MTIKKNEFEIFSRQLILKEFVEKKFIELQNKEISIVGIGGIGCPLAQYLVSCGIKKLNLFDNDIIVKNNLNRQTLYNLNDIGKKKASVAKKKLLLINPNAKINAYSKKIEKKNLELLKNSSIIIDSTDSWVTMKLINEYSVKKNIPLLSASAIGFDIQIILFENKKNKHLCLQCIFPNNKEPEIARCDKVGILGTTTGLAGILGAQKIINFLMKFTNKFDFLTLIDCKSLNISKIKIRNKKNCKVKLIKK